jgi:hypothetical protein
MDMRLVAAGCEEGLEDGPRLLGVAAAEEHDRAEVAGRGVDFAQGLDPVEAGEGLGPAEALINFLQARFRMVRKILSDGHLCCRQAHLSRFSL